MEVADTYRTCACGITRRSFESARRSRSTRRGSSGARCASMLKGAWICSSASSSARANEFIRFSEKSQLGVMKVQANSVAAVSAPRAIDS